MPLPSASKLMTPWFVMVCPACPLLIVALMVMVTEPPLAIEPFQVTVLVPTVATGVPLAALAETSVKPEGRTSENSLPGLSS